MTGHPEDALRPLPVLLRPGLRLVFVGFNPGIESARRGHYYAFHGNVFWRHLCESGLVERQVGFADDVLLADEYGIGFTDLCPRPTVRAGELTPPEIASGAAALHERLLRFQPAIAAFNGRGVFEAYARQALGLTRGELAHRSCGPQPERIGATTPWVVPSSSGLASRWHRQRLALLRELSDVLNENAAWGR